MNTKPTRPAPARQPAHQRGIALMLVIIAVAVASILSVPFLRTQIVSTNIAQNVVSQGCARAIAESAMVIAINHVQSNADWRTDYTHGVWVTDQSLNSGTFTLTGADGQDTDADGLITTPTEGDADLADDPTDPLTLTVTATCNGVSHTLRSVLTNLGQGSGQGAYIAVSDKIEIEDHGQIDSFDSSQGAYSPTNQGSNAVISTNSTSNEKIKIKDDGLIKGDAMVGPGGDPDNVIELDDNGQITGSTAPLTDAVDIPSVTEPSMGSSVGDVEYEDNDTVTITSDLHCDKFEVKDDATVTITGQVTILADDKVAFKDDTQLIITPGSKLTLYSKKEVEIKDDALVNVSSADPAMFEVFHLDDEDFKVKDRGRVYTTLLVPDDKLKIEDDAHFYGTFRGKKLEVKDDGQLHQDLAGSTGTTGDPVVIWDEQP